MKIYPQGQITPYGATLLKERVEPTIIYTSHDEGLQWYINGGLAPMAGVQAGAVLADGVMGLHPPFSHIDHKGARQDGVTNQHTVYDGAEIDMQMELTAPPNHKRPNEAAAQISRVIRDWMDSWDPKNPGRLDWVTPDMGRWWCNPRLFRSPPDREFKAQRRRLRQKYTWTVRNDNAFWRGEDSVCTFHAVQSEFTQAQTTSQVQLLFNQPVSGGIGPQWDQTYTGAGLLEVPVVPGTGLVGAKWTPSGTANASVVNTLQGANTIQTVAPYAGVPTGGSFSLDLDGDGTDDIAFDATPEELQTILENLVSVGAGNVSVTGLPGGPYTVEFLNDLGLQNIPLMTASSDLTGSNPLVSVGVAQHGAGSGLVMADGTTSVTVTTGEHVYAPGGLVDASGNPIPEPAPADAPSINLFGWFDTSKQNGVKATVTTGGFSFISAIVNGITTVIKVGAQLIGSIANAVISLVTEVVQVAVGVFQTVVSLVINGIKAVIGFIGDVIGAVFKLIGFGVGVIGSALGQLPPPPITGVGAGGPATRASGELQLTNFGDQDGYPRYLCYGPGTFFIANGPDSTQMVEFGPLVDGQIALLTTLPRLRGVVDLTPSQPSLAITPEFDNFFSRLVSLATNNNVPPLLEWFQSLFGMRPPQGAMYPLLRGRFTKPIPPKPTGAPAVTSKIACEIWNAGASSKIVAAVTPLRRWPE